MASTSFEPSGLRFGPEQQSSTDAENPSRVYNKPSSVGFRVPSVAQLRRNPASVSEQHKLIILSNPPFPHKLWEGTLGSFETSGSLHFSSSSLTDVSLPPVLTATTPAFSDNIAVKVSLQGRKLNPSVRAEVIISHGDQYSRERILIAQIDWPFSPVKYLGGPLKSGITALDARIAESHEYLELSFVPECAVSTNLLPVAHDLSLLKMADDATLDPKELSLLRDLANLVEQPSGRRIYVRFSIGPQERALLATGNTQTPSSKLLGDLPLMNNRTPSLDFADTRWQCYREEVEDLSSDSASIHESGKTDSTEETTDSVSQTPTSTALTPLQVAFDAMRARRSVLSRPHPGTPVKSVMVFNDQDDALVSLAYGVHLEYEEQNATFQAVRRDAHRVRLCGVDNRVLALIDFTSPPKTGLPDDRFRLDDRTKVELRIGDGCMDSHNKRCLTATGLIVANVFDLPRCDLLVLITDKWAKTFKYLVRPIDEFHLNEGESIWPTEVHVSPQLFKTPYKAEVEAVIRAYGPGCPTERLPFLLGDGSRLTRSNPLKKVAESHVARALGRLREAKMWNEQQQKVIMSVTSAPAGALLVTGPGGTGKTELICHIIRFAVSCGQYGMISGTRNDTLDDMTLKLVKIDSTLRPVRFYAPSQESLGSLYQSAGVSRTVDSSHRLLVDTFDAIEADTRKNRRSLPQFSVLGRVILNLSRDTPLLRRLRCFGSGSPKQPTQDVRAYFRDRLELLYRYHHNKNIPWINGNEEREFIFQAYKYLREEVISEAKIILATNVVCGNTEIGTNFAHNGNVWVFQDEAQSMSEAAALIPLGLNNVCAEGQETRKVVMHFLSGDLKQLPPFTVSRTGEHNTVNEFAAQRSVSLLERKLSSGFPAIPLVEQRRAAEVLMRGANIFHYGGKLTTPPHPPLDHALWNLIPRLAGFTILPHHPQDRRRLAWLEVDAPVYENKYTGSRANPANAGVVRQCLFKVRETYGKLTQSKVMLATPYKRQKELYLSMACELKSTCGWSDKEIPRIVTIDSLIGRESSLVILDLVNNGTEGFLRDVRRSCVAFTRAKDMFLVIGGKFPLPPQDKQVQPKILKDPVTNRSIVADMSRPLAFYHAFFKANNFMYQAKMSEVPKLPMPTDLQPLGHDFEDKQIAEEFTAVHDSFQVEDEQKDGWQFVDGQDYADDGTTTGSVEGLTRALNGARL